MILPTENIVNYCEAELDLDERVVVKRPFKAMPIKTFVEKAMGKSLEFKEAQKLLYDAYMYRLRVYHPSLTLKGLVYLINIHEKEIPDD